MPAPPDGDSTLARYLADRDIPCPACGYNLRDLKTDRCPECGLALRLPLRARSTGLLWRCGLAGMVLCYVLLLVLALSMVAGNILIGGIALLFLLDAPGRIRRWLRTRGAFHALPMHRRQLMAAAWWLAAFAVFFVLAVLVRKR